MGNALAIYAKVDSPIAFAESMAKTFAAMTGVPLEQGAAVALTCLCEGLTPVDYRRRYHTIDGKPCMRADAMLAEFRMNYGGDWEVVERSENLASIVLIDKKERRTPFAFSWDDAQASRWPWKDASDHKKGCKNNWSTPTDRKTMLWARLVSDSLRVVCPELVAGVYTPEEMEDVLSDGNQAVMALAAPRKTATQILNDKAAAAAQATGDVGDVVDASTGGPESGSEADNGEQDAVDAEFEPAAAATNGAANGHANGSPNGNGHAAAPATDDPTAPGSIQDATRLEIVKLIPELFGDQAQTITDKTLAGRGVKSWRNLSKNQGNEVLKKLRDEQRKRAALAKN